MKKFSENKPLLKPTEGGSKSTAIIDFLVIYSNFRHFILAAKSQRPVSGLNIVGSLHSRIILRESVNPHFINLRQFVGCGMTLPVEHWINGKFVRVSVMLG